MALSLAVLWGPLGQVAGAAKWAAVLVDMQSGFSNYGKSRGLSDAQTARVLKPQAMILRSLAAKGVPIAILEYNGHGPTNPILMGAIGSGRCQVVKKSTDDGFCAPELHELLQRWGATDLIVMGANRGYCVLSTVRGAERKSCYAVHVPWSAVEEYNLGSRAEITRQARALRPEYEQHATVYSRANALLELIPAEAPAPSSETAAQAPGR